PTLMVPFQGAHQMITVATIVAVTFASWPVYSCWLPSLSAFTLCSLTPVIVAGAVQFGVSQTLIALIILVTTVFILYSGRKLNEMVVNSIITAAQNERLVERLRIEIARAEKARRQTEEERSAARVLRPPRHPPPLQARGFTRHSGRRATPQTVPVVKRTLALDFGHLDPGRAGSHRHAHGVRADGAHPEHKRAASESSPRSAVRRGKEGPEASRSVPPVTIPDVTMVKRALKNLVSNAVAYSDPAKARVPEIVLGARRVESRLVIGVYDCGPGISAEDRSRIFGTFYRGAAGRAAPGSGYGLGLSIVRGIARQLGLELTLGSKPGRGSVFRLAFSIDESEQADRFEKAVPIGGETGSGDLLPRTPLVRDALRDARAGER
ncbi:MAG: sensor histidine kinase, partial [Sutterella wadsworthensis]